MTFPNINSLVRASEEIYEVYHYDPMASKGSNHRLGMCRSVAMLITAFSDMYFCVDRLTGRAGSPLAEAFLIPCRIILITKTKSQLHQYTAASQLAAIFLTLFAFAPVPSYIKNGLMLLEMSQRAFFVMTARGYCD